MRKKDQQSTKSQFKPDDSISSELVLNHLQQLLGSPNFDATKSQRAFLEYILHKTISGHSNEIKAFTIATEVFGRSESFDQNTDPFVSIHANKLRRSLERYYLLSGHKDMLRIQIPKGTYVPVFTLQTGTESSAIPISKRPALGIRESWPTLLVLPLENLTGHPEKDYLGIGLSTELAVELARFDEIKVLFPREQQIADISAGDARFIFDGGVYEDSTGLKVSVHLLDTQSGRQIWADTYRSNFKPKNFFSFQEKIVHEITTNVSGESGVIPRFISNESKNKPPNALSTYEAILRFYEYDQTLTPESFVRAMEGLHHAATIEPGCSQVWSLLARLYANIYSLDFPGFENPLEKAVEYAEKGVRINPNNQRNMAILGLVRFFSNELSAALNAFNRALELNPNSLLFIDGLAYFMILSGAWKQGKALAGRAMKLNPYYRPVLHYALWTDCLRREDYEGAYLETMGLRRPTVFWYPLSKAASLGLLGRIEEGETHVKKLLELKPDFPSKGRVLISHYIKFEEIAERVIEGLSKVGIEMD